MEAASSGQKANRGCHAAADRARKRSWSGPRSSSHKTMTTYGSPSQSQLSTDLEMLHARVKGKSLTLAELKQALKDRGSAMPLVLLALPFCFISIPGLSTPFGIAICLIGACLVIGRE